MKYAIGLILGLAVGIAGFWYYMNAAIVPKAEVAARDEYAAQLEKESDRTQRNIQLEGTLISATAEQITVSITDSWGIQGPVRFALDQNSKLLQAQPKGATPLPTALDNLKPGSPVSLKVDNTQTPIYVQEITRL